MSKDVINAMLDDLYAALDTCETDERSLILDDICRLKRCERTAC